MDELRSLYRYRALELTADGKPLDFGGDGINGSVDLNGRITAINAFHPVQGYVTVTTAPPFPEYGRYDPQAVRAYRTSLVNVAGFGLHFTIPIVKCEAWLIEDAIPCIRLTLENGVTAEVITFVPLENPVGVMQWWQFSEAGRFAYFGGELSLQRCAYTQLTEGGPLPMPSFQTNIFEQHTGMVGLKNSALGWFATITGEKCVEREDGTVEFTNTESNDSPAHNKKEIELHTGLGLTPSEAVDHFTDLQHHKAASLLQSTLNVWQKRWQGWRYDHHPLDLALRRGLVYGLNCCVPVSDEATCIITDHQLLPLSWNRDAYYVALALLRWHTDMTDVVRRHLVWLFEVAERTEQTDGMWGRSYLANGKLKDSAFQLDQQLFPLLELAKYMEATNEKAFLNRLRASVAQIVDAICAREVQGLFATDETPADDPVAMPYHLSSHILLWHTFRKLAVLIEDKNLSDIADRVYDAIWREFVAEHDGQTLFAYLTNGVGKHQFYHDANDLPLVLAPVWGFCPVDDPVWRTTIDFAFSSENKGGYYSGQYGGLGSVHTPNTWPLGDVQRYIVARLTGNRSAEKVIIERLTMVAQHDGALPEAYSPETGKVVSRHWFSWPGAALALYFTQLESEKI